MKKIILSIILVNSLFAGAMDTVPNGNLTYVYHSEKHKCLNTRDNLVAKDVLDTLMNSQYTKLEYSDTDVAEFSHTLENNEYRFYFFKELSTCNRFIVYLDKQKSVE